MTATHEVDRSKTAIRLHLASSWALSGDSRKVHPSGKAETREELETNAVRHAGLHLSSDQAIFAKSTATAHAIRLERADA